MTAPVTDPAEIARGLTPEQKAALQGRFRWSSIMDQDVGEVGLYRLGLWNLRPKRGEGILTPLGESVADYLRGEA